MLPASQACGWEKKQRRGLRSRLRYHRKLVAVSKILATRFEDTIELPSQACGLGILLRCHRKLVAVSTLPATRFGDTITLPSQACGCEQLTSDELLGTRLYYHRKLVALSTLKRRRDLETRLCDHRKLVAVSTFLISDVVWGHDCVTIASWRL